MATGTFRTTSPAISQYWGMLKDLSDPVKIELVALLSSSMAYKEEAPVLDDDRRLDEALAKFHSDWGGSGTAMEIAESLREGRVNTRTVDTW